MAMDKKLDRKLDRTTPPPLPNWAFCDGRVVPYRDASFGLLTHGLNYGTGFFAGLRGYWNAEERQLFVFRPEDHFRRFCESARLLRMEFPFTPAQLTSGLIELLRAEGYRENVYIRPISFYGDQSIGVRLHHLTPVVGMAAVPFGSYIGKEDGIHVAISSWTRVSDNQIPARGKLAGSYVNSALAKTDAVLAGFDEAILLNDHGHVCEGSVENVFMLRGGVVVTPPVTDDVLEGFTRATVIQLLREDMGRTVIERSIDRTELYLADEVLLTGTGAEISPVAGIDHRTIGSGGIGPLAAELRARYMDTVSGRVAKHRGWCRPVYAASPDRDGVKAPVAAEHTPAVG
jgi:branched-chain amino acid aminotransferase